MDEYASKRQYRERAGLRSRLSAGVEWTTELPGETWIEGLASAGFAAVILAEGINQQGKPFRLVSKLV